jgi:hypothetical protein
MNGAIANFQTPKEQNEAERRYYQSLTPAQRLDILLDLLNFHDARLDPEETRFRLVYQIRNMTTGRIIRSGGSPNQFRRPPTEA